MPAPDSSSQMNSNLSAGSNALWAHLRRKDVSSSQTGGKTYAPIAPLDKTGISMRILLSDTQANSEKFGERVQTLAGRVDGTMLKISAIPTLWEEDREKSSGQMVETRFYHPHILERPPLMSFNLFLKPTSAKGRYKTLSRNKEPHLKQPNAIRHSSPKG